MLVLVPVPNGTCLTILAALEVFIQLKGCLPGFRIFIIFATYHKKYFFSVVPIWEAQQ